MILLKKTLTHISIINTQLTRVLLTMGFDKASSLTRVKDKRLQSINKFAVIKKAKKVNRLYERVSNPLYLVELTETHFPNITPYRLMFSIALTHMFGQMSLIHEVYDKLSTSKDLCEGTVKIIKKRYQQRNCIKTSALYAIKIYIILYKVIWLVLESNGVSKNEYAIATLFDYMNFVLAHF